MKLGIGLIGTWALGASVLFACSQTEQPSSEVAGTDTATLVAALSANSDGSTDTWFDAAGGEPVRVMGCGFGHIVDKVVQRFDADQSGELDAEERATLVDDFGDDDSAAADDSDDAADATDDSADDATDDVAVPVRSDAGPGRGHGHRRHGRVAMLLSVYDADGSGTLEAAELEQLKADIEARCEARLAKLVAEFDADGDGTLSEEEWATAHAALRERFQHRHDERVRELDADGDGVLDLAEEQQAEETADADRSDAEQSFDQDGDGQLSSEERDALRANGRECVRDVRPMMSRAGSSGHGVPNGRTPAAADDSDDDSAADDTAEEATPAATPS
jgi:Ca2+-binding EF-hand superfamily protein